MKGDARAGLRVHWGRPQCRRGQASGSTGAGGGQGIPKGGCAVGVCMCACMQGCSARVLADVVKVCVWGGAGAGDPQGRRCGVCV